MLIENINALKIIPEKFETARTSEIDPSIVRSEMA